MKLRLIKLSRVILSAFPLHWEVDREPEMMTRANKTRTHKTRQRGSSVDLQRLLVKTAIEWHWPVYQYLGARMQLQKCLKCGNPGINRLDKLAKQHDIDYGRAKTLLDNWKADAKMIKAIDHLPGSPTVTERIVKRNLQAKKTLKL